MTDTLIAIKELTPNTRALGNPISLMNGEVNAASDLATELIRKFGFQWKVAAEYDGAPNDGRCFWRAGKIARRNFKRYLYVEGSCDGNHHGWLLCRDGSILDPTYGAGTRSYVGVPFGMMHGDGFLREGFSLFGFIESTNDIEILSDRLVTPTEVRNWMNHGSFEDGPGMGHGGRESEISQILGATATQQEAKS